MKTSSFIEKGDFGGQGLGLARGLANTLSYDSCPKIQAFLLRERYCSSRFSAWLRTDKNARFREACGSQRDRDKERGRAKDVGFHFIN